MNLTVTCHIGKASAGTFSLSSRKGRKDVNLAALQEWSLRPVLTSKLNLCACFLPYRCPLSLLKKLFIWPKASLTTDPWVQESTSSAARFASLPLQCRWPWVLPCAALRLLEPARHFCTPGLEAEPCLVLDCTHSACLLPVLLTIVVLFYSNQSETSIF